jgi:CRISPR/Cas system-associated exonuclease Cas4 (RecB family)
MGTRKTGLEIAKWVLVLAIVGGAIVLNADADAPLDLAAVIQHATTAVVAMAEF